MNDPCKWNLPHVNDRLLADSNYEARQGVFMFEVSSKLSTLFFDTVLETPPHYTLGTKEANEREHEG